MLSLAFAFGGALAAIASVAGASSLTIRQTDFAVQNWTNDFAKVHFVNGPGGIFSVDWNNPPGGNFVVGKGYVPARDMLLNYSGSFEVDGWAYLALYGWTMDPLVEYYVIESMGEHNPSDNASATQYGTLTSDGGTYEIWQKERINAPSIIGDHTNFQQYWSIRTKMHCGGTINTGNHFRAWEAAGLKLGKQSYMVMGIEGQQGSGHANITVGVKPRTPVPETPTSTYRSVIRTSTTRRTTSTPATTTNGTMSVPATTTSLPVAATTSIALK